MRANLNTNNSDASKNNRNFNSDVVDLEAGRNHYLPTYTNSIGRWLTTTRDYVYIKLLGLDGLTPADLLIEAVKLDDIWLAKYALNNGADIEFFYLNLQESRTALHWAAFWGEKNCVAFLLEQGANPNAKDKVGRTPLHLAVWQGHSDIVSLLLNQQSIDLEAKDVKGQTPLYWAALWQHTDCVQLLYEKGADITCANDAGKRPLDAAQENQRAIMWQPGPYVKTADYIKTILLSLDEGKGMGLGFNHNNNNNIRK